MAPVITHMTDEGLNSYYRMPPVGITEARANAAGHVRVQYTVRCGSQKCWFVGNAASKDDAKILLDEHTCPTGPRRNELPTGYSTLEKLWDELDEVTWALVEHETYMVGDLPLHSSGLQGYARGIAFALSMMCHPHFRTTDEIAREARKRYRIRKGTEPYSPTPGYRYNPAFSPPTYPPNGEKEPWMGATEAYSAKKQVQKTRGRTTTPSSRKSVDLSKLDTKQASQIRTAHSLGMFTEAELAEQYEVTVETIRAICGS